MLNFPRKHSTIQVRGAVARRHRAVVSDRPACGLTSRLASVLMDTARANESPNRNTRNSVRLGQASSFGIATKADLWGVRRSSRLANAIVVLCCEFRTQ